MSTPNQRSKELLESEGYKVALVERYNYFAQTRHDLFGVFDLLCVGHGKTIAIQATTNSNLSARRKKMAASETVPLCLAARWSIEIHGWAKRGNRWRCRRIEFSNSS